MRVVVAALLFLFACKPPAPDPMTGDEMDEIDDSDPPIVDDDQPKIDPPIPPARPLAYSADASVNEGDGTVTLSLALVEAAAGALEFSVTTVNGTATAGADYTSVSTSVTINLGAIGAEITIPIEEDQLQEPSETFTVQIRANAASLALLAANQGNIDVTVTIADNDTPIVIPPGIPRLWSVTIPEADTPNSVQYVTLPTGPTGSLPPFSIGGIGDPLDTHVLVAFSPSPDGEHVAFAFMDHDESAMSDTSVLQIDAVKVTLPSTLEWRATVENNGTTGPDPLYSADTFFYWSPDSKRIVYQAHVVGEADEVWSMHTIHKDGTHEKELASVSEFSVELLDSGHPKGSWSFDGTQYAFRDQDTIRVLDKDENIITAGPSADGDLSPVWNPTRNVFLHIAPDGDDNDTRDDVCIAGILHPCEDVSYDGHMTALPKDLAWSPDGAHISYLDDMTQNATGPAHYRLVVVNKNTTLDAWVYETPFGGVGTVPRHAWAQDSSAIVFLQHNEVDDLDEAELYSVAADGGQTSMREISLDQSAITEKPITWFSISPASDKVAYLWGTSATELHIASTRTHHSGSNVTPVDHDVQVALWTPNGQRLFFAALIAGNETQIGRLNSDGSAFQAFGSYPAGHGYEMRVSLSNQAVVRANLNPTRYNAYDPDADGERTLLMPPTNGTRGQWVVH